MFPALLIGKLHVLTWHCFEYFPNIKLDTIRDCWRDQDLVYKL